MPLRVAALIVGGGSKSLALSALTSPPLFSVAKTRFIPKVSFLRFFVCCGVFVRCRCSSCFRLISSGGLISPPLPCWACFLNKRIFFYTIEGRRCAYLLHCTFLLTPAGAAVSVAKTPVSAELFPE